MREKKIKNQGNANRDYVSLFGAIKINRLRYYIEEYGNYHPLDEYLNFPKKKLSYALQDLIGKTSTEENFRESVSLLHDLLDLKLQGSQTKRIVEDIGPVVEEYYEQQDRLSPDKVEEEGDFLAFGNDGKGVPIVKRERGSQGSSEKGRLMKGKKRGVKKQATVAVSFSFNPRKRESEDILRGLFKEPTPAGKERKDEKDRRPFQECAQTSFYV